MVVEIGIRAHTDLEAFAFGPLDERQLPIGPTRRTGVAREMVELQVADVGGVLRVGRARPGDAPALPRRLVQIARRHRPLHRNVRAADVEVRSAEVVVGVPGVRREREHDARTGRRTHDEEGTVAPHLVADVDLHDDLVVARAPRRTDVEGECRRPPATVRCGIPRRVVFAGRDRVGGEHDFASPAPTRATSTRTGRPPDDDMCTPTWSPGRADCGQQYPVTSSRATATCRRR